jgi:hypothetical protein
MVFGSRGFGMKRLGLFASVVAMMLAGSALQGQEIDLQKRERSTACCHLKVFRKKVGSARGN